MKNEIRKLLEETFPALDFDASDKLADDGILDSLTIVQIIGELSMEYDVEFSFEDLSNENFNSIDAIAALVEGLLK